MKEPVSAVYNECNRFGLSLFPDQYFFLSIDDPPYFSGPEKRKFYGYRVSPIGVKRVDYPANGHWQVPGPEYFDELKRISAHQIIWGCNYFKYDFSPGRIVWDKCNGKSSFSDCEIAYCSFHDSVRLFRFMWSGMLQGKSIEEGWIQQGNKKLNEKRIHPTQKPVALYDWLFSKYPIPVGAYVVDPHVGSGSSRIAAYKAGVNFIGFEIDNTAFMKQEERFKKFIEQYYERYQTKI
ncbi:MAG: DNA methyltransferase [Prolixibacteraceae bacterium]